MSPLILVLFISFLVPHTSFLGHVCGLAFGYGCKYSSTFQLMYIANSHRGVGLPQIPRTTGEDPQMD
jgi:hypothetical protein